MTRLALLLATLALSGCAPIASMPAHEKAFHALNLLDTGQTINTARRPDCYREIGFPTTQLVGEHPSELEIYATSASYSYLYHRFARIEPETRTGKLAQRALGWAIVGAKAATVWENNREGVRPWGSGC